MKNIILLWMSAFPAIGTQIQIAFTPKFATFTADQLRLSLQERGFIMGQGQVPHPQDPQVTITVVSFSKGNVNVMFNPKSNAIAFLILNTLDLNEIYEEIGQILFSLNINSEVILKITFLCSTRSLSEELPSTKLTSLINETFLEGIRETSSPDLKISSLRLSTTIPLLNANGYEIIIEPLLTSPTNQYFIRLIYQTDDLDEFNTFIGDFGHSTIQDIIRVVDGNG